MSRNILGKHARARVRAVLILLDLISLPMLEAGEGVDDNSFILVNPTSGWRQKSWLPECWAQMLTALRNDTSLNLS